MMSLRLPVLCVSLAMAAMLGACGKEDATPANAVGKEESLPKACVEAEAAQRRCTETMAASYERVGQAGAAKMLRDALPGELEKARASWSAVGDKEGLERACTSMRDALRAQPQCSGK
ncbi:hypothetical protein [Cupriavidus campinensis]